MLIKGMPVSLLAEAMFHDAWDYHGKSTSEATANSALFYDSDIRRICQVSNIDLECFYNNIFKCT